MYIKIKYIYINLYKNLYLNKIWYFRKQECSQTPHDYTSFQTYLHAEKTNTNQDFPSRCGGNEQDLT